MNANSTLATNLSMRHVTMISIGGCIGAGLFVGSAAAINIGGPAVVLTYIGCGSLVFLIMRMLGEMACAMPGKGSFAEYASLGLGEWAGFTVRWLYWYFWVFVIGAEAVVGAQMLHDIGLALPVWLIGLVLVFGLTATNLLSVRAYGELETVFSALKLLAIVFFIVMGGVFIMGANAHPIATLTQSGGLLPNGAGALLAAIPVVIWSMMGSEMAAIVAAESSDPAGNIVKAARNVTLRIIAFYVASIILIVSILPWDKVVVGKSPFAQAMAAIHIPYAEGIMTATVIIAVLSCLNSSIYVTSRMMYELGQRGDAPRWFGVVTAHKVPSLATLFCCGAGFAAALAQFLMQENLFTLLVSTSGYAILMIYIIMALAQIRLRQKLEAAGQNLPFKMWLFPYLSYITVAAIVAVLAYLGASSRDGAITLGLNLLTLAIVLAAFYLRRAPTLQERQG